MKKLAPLKSVRKYCLWCMNEQSSEVKLCPSKDCPLFEFRFGKRKKGKSVLKAIKAKCKDCGENAKKCEFPKCPLFIYRTGHNPSIKGNNTKGNIEFIKRAMQQAKVRKTGLLDRS